MIIKNLARKNSNGGDQLVKYIFKYIFRDQDKGTRRYNHYNRPLIPRSVRLSPKDFKYLKAEKVDTKLMADFKLLYPNLDYSAFIQNYLVANKGEQNQQSPFVIRHNMRAITLNGFVREFERNERSRVHKRVDQTSIHHTIISFSNKDSNLVTEAMMRDLTREYIRLRGDKNMYVGTVHSDKAHIHLHLAMSGTTLEGKSARISQKEFEDVKVKLQEYQLKHYPELVHSLPKHGRAKQEKQKDEVQKIIRTERTSIKNSLQGCLESVINSSSSTEHFISQLQENGYSVYYRSNRLTGVQCENGLKFRFSRLVDLDVLKALDNQGKALNEIKTIRNRGKDIEKEKNTESLKNEDKELQEIADIRDRVDRGMERSLDDDTDVRDISDEVESIDYGETEEDDSDDTECDSDNLQDNSNEINNEPD